MFTKEMFANSVTEALSSYFSLEVVIDKLIIQQWCNPTCLPTSDIKSSPPSIYMPKETSGSEKLSKKSPTASAASRSIPTPELIRTRRSAF